MKHFQNGPKFQTNRDNTGGMGDAPWEKSVGISPEAWRAASAAKPNEKSTAERFAGTEAAWAATDKPKQTTRDEGRELVRCIASAKKRGVYAEKVEDLFRVSEFVSRKIIFESADYGATQKFLDALPLKGTNNVG